MWLCMRFLRGALLVILSRAHVAAQLQQVAVGNDGSLHDLESGYATPSIQVSFTADMEGKMPLPRLSVGDRFFLQLHAHTGGYGLTSFEVKLIEDAAVCRFDPQGGDAPGWPDAAEYEGKVWAAAAGGYAVELASRWRDIEDKTTFFVKYSRFGRTRPLVSAKAVRARIGYLRMVAVTSGSCISSALITAMYHSGGAQHIPPIEAGTPAMLRDRMISVMDASGHDEL